MLVNTNVKISDPDRNQVVFFRPWCDIKQGETGKEYPVIINSGRYLSGGRLSNYWTWCKVTPTGKISEKIESGYGNFYIAEGFEVEIVRKITIK